MSRKDREILDHEHHLQQIHEQKQRRKCDWSNPEDVAAYRASRRLEKRLKRIQKFAPGFVCPSCRAVLPSSISWVLGRDFAVCRTCHAGTPKENEVLALRKKHGMSQSQFAEMMGWSQSYQCSIEKRDVSVSLLTQIKLRLIKK
jgi:DNA-binding XRE family transcriptional regulator